MQIIFGAQGTRQGRRYHTKEGGQVEAWKRSHEKNPARAIVLPKSPIKKPSAIVALRRMTAEDMMNGFQKSSSLTDGQQMAAHSFKNLYYISRNSFQPKP